MAAKIFVGNFSFSIDDEKLREYFANVGSVISAKVMKEGPGGRSRGFGFVEFESQEDAQKAISTLDGSSWDGRVIKVSEDRSTRHGGGGGAPHHGGGGGYQGGGGSYQDSDGGRGGSSDYGSRSAGGPTGYFRAQPLDLGFRRRRKVDPLMEDPQSAIDYKDPKTLARFMSERGRILPRRITGLSAANQRMVKRAVKRAQHLALLPITSSS